MRRSRASVAGIAGDGDDGRDGGLRQRLGGRPRAGAGRVEDDGIEGLQLHGRHRIAAKIAAVDRHRAVLRGGAQRGDHLIVAFHRQYGRDRGEREGERAASGIEIGDAAGRLLLERGQDRVDDRALAVGARLQEGRRPAAARARRRSGSAARGARRSARCQDRFARTGGRGRGRRRRRRGFRAPRDRVPPGGRGRTAGRSRCRAGWPGCPRPCRATPATGRACAAARAARRPPGGRRGIP